MLGHDFLRLWRRQATVKADRYPARVTEKAIAITGGDADYFDLLRDCVGSLRATEEGRAMALGILDCGLTDEQRAWCRGAGRDLRRAAVGFRLSRPRQA